MLASTTATMFGVVNRVSPLSGIAALPIALWEFSPSVWPLVKGFKPSPITTGMPLPAT